MKLKYSNCITNSEYNLLIDTFPVSKQDFKEIRVSKSYVDNSISNEQYKQVLQLITVGRNKHINDNINKSIRIFDSFLVGINNTTFTKKELDKLMAKRSSIFLIFKGVLCPMCK